jgi:hypothetical protein
MAAFFFICMLLPIVLGTSYFFNYFLVPRYFLKKQYFWFGLYTVYTVIVSLYLETIVLMFTFVYLGNFSFYDMGPNATDSILLGVILYLLVFVGSVLLLIQQFREKQQIILSLLAEQDKLKIPFLEIRSNRKMVKIPLDEIYYIESLADYIQVNTVRDQIVSKEKISNIEQMLPSKFLRIHRSFIVNKEKINSYTYNEVVVDDTELNIGRSYRKKVRVSLNQ